MASGVVEVAGGLSWVSLIFERRGEGSYGTW